MKRDQIVGVILVGIGIIAILLIQQFPILEASQDPGPRLFPYIGSIGMIVCGAGIFFRKGQENEENVMSREALKRSSLLIGLLIIYGLALEFIGYLIATPVFLFIFVALFASGKVSRVKAIIFSLVSSFLLYFIFQNLLNIFLPAGHFY